MSTQVESSDPKELISIEITKVDKEKLEKIALLRGISVNEYLLNIALHEAEKIDNVLITEEVNLSAQDWQIVVSAIDNSPEINPKLKQAIERYQENQK